MKSWRMRTKSAWRMRTGDPAGDVPSHETSGAGAGSRHGESMHVWHARILRACVARERARLVALSCGAGGAVSGRPSLSVDPPPVDVHPSLLEVVARRLLVARHRHGGLVGDLAVLVVRPVARADGIPSGLPRLDEGQPLAQHLLSKLDVASRRLVGLLRGGLVILLSTVDGIPVWVVLEEILARLDHLARAPRLIRPVRVARLQSGEKIPRMERHGRADEARAGEDGVRRGRDDGAHEDLAHIPATRSCKRKLNVAASRAGVGRQGVGRI
mmetsp:Transcript_6276/g.20010  ORF Transcript_6276/g.20010 Transcript_6276/m.20010 type:complete len:271 (-) Transcript_6276:1583-2395(-)